MKFLTYNPKMVKRNIIAKIRNRIEFNKDDVTETMFDKSRSFGLGEPILGLKTRVYGQLKTLSDRTENGCLHIDLSDEGTNMQ